MSVEFIENKEILPICPHCKREIKSVYFSKVSDDLGRKCIYFCPECKAVLGISHRKGLILGL